MNRVLSRPAVRTTALWVVFPLLLSVVLQLAEGLYHRAGSHMLDMEVYRAGANAVLDGVSPYSVVSGAEELLFTYPPFSLFFFLPLGPLSLNLVALLWTALSVAALQLAVYLALREVRARRVWTLTVVTTMAALLFNPVDQTLQWGQVSLVLLALVLVDLWLPDTARFKGVLTGIAAGIKIFPAAFVVYYAFTDRRRAASTLVGTAVGSVLLAWLVFPAYSREFWLDDVMNTDRIAPTGWVPNESMRAMLARVLHSESAALLPWLALSAAAVVAAAVATRAAHRIGEDRLGLVAVALAILLISPVSWHHYWVWIIPVAIFLGDAARRRSSVFLWLCAVVPVAVIALRVNEWVIPEPPYDPLLLDPLPLFTTSIVTYTTILLLAAVCAYTLVHRDDRAERTAEPAVGSAR
jgi:alpha-1,2-mannosyltransferase